MVFTFCPVCGGKLEDREIGDEGLIPYCGFCKRPFFDNPATCVIALVVNEKKQVCLLKSNYISRTHWTLVAGYVKKGSTLEENAIREIKEETGQVVKELIYVSSYYFKPLELVMAGFVAMVESRPFGRSNEVDDIMWCDIGRVNDYIIRENNMSGVHFDNSIKFLENCGSAL